VQRRQQSTLLVRLSRRHCIFTSPASGSEVFQSVCLYVCHATMYTLHNVHNYIIRADQSLLAGKWPDRHQTCTRWTPGQCASMVCSRSRSRSKVTWYGHFCAGTKIASWRLLRYVELFIIRVKFAIYYFLHSTKVRQVAARLRAKSAVYDCLVLNHYNQNKYICKTNNFSVRHRGLISDIDWRAVCCLTDVINVRD